MAENENAQSAVSDPDAGTKRLTPVDVQQKQFRLAFRGYHEREVDEFLDQMTEELARLHAENRRLQEEVQFNRAAGPGSPGRDAAQALGRAREEAARIVTEARDRAAQFLEEARRTPAAAVPVAAIGGDTGAGEEALNRLAAREREFLQRLAALIQEHMEAFKDEVRTAKETPAPAVQAEAPAPAWQAAADEAPAPAWQPAAAEAPVQPSAEPPPGAALPVGEPAIEEVVPEPDASTFVGAAAADEAPPVLETTGPAAWERPLQERSEPAWREKAEPARPAWEATPAAADAAVEPEAASISESIREPEPERTPEPPPDLMPADADLPEPTPSWQTGQVDESRDDGVGAEHVATPTDFAADVEPGSVLEPSIPAEDSDFDEPSASQDAWPPAITPQEGPAEPVTPSRDDAVEFEPESEAEPEREPDRGSPLFDQPTLTGEDAPAPEPPTRDWPSTGREQDIGGVPGKHAQEREGEEDQSLRELFWGEES